MNTMPIDLQLWVRERMLATAVEAGQLADGYIQIRRTALGTSKEAQRNPNEKGRGATKGLRGICSGMTTAGLLPKTGMESVKCYNGSQKGHIASRGPSNTTMFDNSTGSESDIFLRHVSGEGCIEDGSVTDILNSGVRGLCYDKT